MGTRGWFAEMGWFHRPASWQGTILLLVWLAFCVNVFLAVDRHSHSVSDTLYGVFPFIVPAFLLLEWVASKTTPPRQHGDLARAH